MKKYYLNRKYKLFQSIDGETAPFIYSEEMTSMLRYEPFTGYAYITY